MNWCFTQADARAMVPFVNRARRPQVNHIYPMTAGLALCALLSMSCSIKRATPADDTAAVDGVTDAGGGDASGSSDTAAAGADTASTMDASAVDTGSASAQPPATKPYALGKCPKFVAGANKITAGGAERSFRLFLPADPKGAPLVFLWHGLGDSAANFSGVLGAAGIASTRGAVIVAPDAVAPTPTAMAVWQFPSMLAQKPPAFDLLLFDSLLTCIDEQYDIDNARISIAGFSAGAIWSSYLLLHRGEWLAAAVILSGGIDPAMLFPYIKPKRPVPVLGAHGGASDVYMSLLKFNIMMKTLIETVVKDGHLAILCDHGQGHTVTGPLAWGAWDFALSHSWGQPSVWNADRVKSKLPDYCTMK